MISGKDSFKGTILIVDDDADNLSVLNDLLYASNYRVLVALNGTQGIRHAEIGQPDLILLDILMPRIDGYETCRRLKGNPKTRNIPVIFLSAVLDTEYKVRSFKIGAADYITKPYDSEELLARVHTHVTLRKRQLEIQESEERYRTLFETAGDAIFVAEPTSGFITDANQCAEELIGMSREEIIGMHQVELHPPEAVEQSRRFFKDAVETRGKRFAEVEVCHKNGRRIPVEVSSGGLIQVFGRQYHFGIFRDISDRKKAEEEHQERERLFCTLYKNMSDGVAIYDAINGGENFVLYDMNATGERITRLSKIDAIGKPLTLLFPGIENSAFIEAVRRVWSSGHRENPQIIFYDEHQATQWRILLIDRLAVHRIVTIFQEA